ncbi:hypothetical protein P170DRAFT_514626 [Aspergillus steynii IBT 23096]|uniref:Arrestin C-terminal-like domain-containing protein n=1 Tax=Aspergillus steynii IBT 23096 TaxID=1392250 RepID=A0A2I2FS01_9EURO|nr:uncharacterized protein P170DRAFT_514626 [Aspergillus steynii IBT 23096]PLB43401.1 hypothetical protein P170DRAFT_514626 [Aspergillus steynii IBT 23096]
MVFSANGICCSLRLDQSRVFLPSTQQTETKPSISGTLCLSLSGDTPIRGISVQVKGQTKLPFQEGIISSTSHEEVTFVRSQTLASSKKMASFILPAGKYEFPFDVPLDPNMHETIAGPNHEYHSYKVYGIIERRFYRNHVVSEPIRIYRPAVEDSSVILLSDPRVAEDLSEATIPYSISIPHKKIPFGSTFPVNFWMAPLNKGLKMKSINLAVVEKHSIKIEAPAAYATRYGVRHLTSAKDHILFTEHHEEHEDDYLAPASEWYDIEWSTTKAVSLPKSLNECTQRVKSNHIQIHHELVFTVELLHAEGRRTLIRGSLPFSIVMLPELNTPDGAVCGFTLEQFLHDYDSPPPLYGAHTSDPMLTGNLAGVESSSEGQNESLTAPADLPWAPCYDLIFGCSPDYETLSLPQGLV